MFPSLPRFTRRNNKPCFDRPTFLGRKAARLNHPRGRENNVVSLTNANERDEQIEHDFSGMIFALHYRFPGLKKFVCFLRSTFPHFCCRLCETWFKRAPDRFSSPLSDIPCSCWRRRYWSMTLYDCRSSSNAVLLRRLVFICQTSQSDYTSPCSRHPLRPPSLPDSRWRHDKAHRARNYYPHSQVSAVFHLRGQPAGRSNPGKSWSKAVECFLT